MNPVFIGGCGRSGTTLLGAMLGAHSDCLCVPESQFAIDVLRHFNFQSGEMENVKGVVEFIRNHWRFRLWDVDIDNEKVPFNQINNSYACFLNWIVKIYGESVNNPNPKIWVDHTPENIKNVGTLANLFPESKFIHIVRDGRAVASSVMPLDWGPNTITKAALWWVAWVGFGLGTESFLERNQIIRIKYEDLVSEPEHTLKQICTYLRLDYQSQMINGNGFRVPGYSAMQHSLVGKKPDAKRVNSWEKKLSCREIEIFESLTGEFLNYLGYEPKFGLKARKMKSLENLVYKVYDYKRHHINRRLKKRRIRNSYKG